MTSPNTPNRQTQHPGRSSARLSVRRGVLLALLAGVAAFTLTLSLLPATPKQPVAAATNKSTSSTGKPTTAAPSGTTLSKAAAKRAAKKRAAAKKAAAKRAAKAAKKTSAAKGGNQTAKPKPGVTKAKPVTSPNFVVFVTDDMRADDLRWMPRTRKHLAGEGIDYRQAISPHPLCCPARAELFTGMYAHNNGVIHNMGDQGGYPAFKPAQSVAIPLRAHGYQTAMVGKYLNAYLYGRDGRDPGWDIFDPMIAWHMSYTKYMFTDRKLHARNAYATTAIHQRTLNAIDTFAKRDRPFMLMAYHIAPHQYQVGRDVRPPVPEKKYRHLYPNAKPPTFNTPAFNEEDVTDKPWGFRSNTAKDVNKMLTLHRARIRSLQSVDVAVAQTIAHLKKRKLLDNTYVVFTSDNGFNLGEHRVVSKNRLYKESLLVPLLVRGPGVPRGVVSDEPASILDITATIMGRAQIARPARLDGRDLFSAENPRDTTLVQHGYYKGHGKDDWAYRGVQTDRYMYAFRPSRPATRVLFDHDRDPHELVNVADHPDYVDVVAELQRRADILIKCKGQTSCNRVFGPVPEPLPGPFPPLR